MAIAEQKFKSGSTRREGFLEGSEHSNDTIKKPDFCLFDLNQQDIALEILSKLQCDVVLDAGSWKENTEAFLNRADIVISSENFKSPENRTIFELNECNNALLAITRGNKDITYLDHSSVNEKEDVIPVDDEIECVDSLAAGDIFHGAFCYAYYELQKNFREALAYANEIAQESIKHIGPRTWENGHN